MIQLPVEFWEQSAYRVHQLSFLLSPDLYSHHSQATGKEPKILHPSDTKECHIQLRKIFSQRLIVVQQCNQGRMNGAVAPGINYEETVESTTKRFKHCRSHPSLPLPGHKSSPMLSSASRGQGEVDGMVSPSKSVSHNRRSPASSSTPGAGKGNKQGPRGGFQGAQAMTLL